MAAHTVKALEEDKPAAGGTIESMRIFMPLGCATSPITGELNARMAL